MTSPGAGGRAVVLVTGMSGTGKSSALAKLGRRGHDVVDTDSSGWLRRDAAEPAWDLPVVAAALQAHRTGWLFVAACVANQGELYGSFDAVVLLSAPLDILLARVADRTNPFGATPADRARIASDLAEFESVLRRGATHEIVTTSPLSDVVDTLERTARTVAR